MREHRIAERTLPTESDFSQIEMDLHLHLLRRDHAELYECVDVERARRWSREVECTRFVDDFGTDDGGGRGTSYLRAQARNVTARASGIEQLLGFIRDSGGTPRKKVVDVLGGDGLVRRVACSLGLSDLDVLTCDLSPYMVRAAWSANHPALLQRADRLLQRDESMDGVLVAYGSHHIAPEDRFTLVRESYRVLRPGGVLVLHDFLVGSPMDCWFGQIVDRYSQTGHRFEHFTREELLGYLTTAGFETCETVDMPDPYVATGPTGIDAELEIGRYLLDMYGLVEIDRLPQPEAERWAIEQAKRIFRYRRVDGGVDQCSVCYDERTGSWCCTVPRMAMVGVGRKAC